MGLEFRYLSTLLRQVCGSNCKQNGGMRRGEEPTHFDNTSSRAASSPRLEYSLHNALGRPVTRNTGSTSGRTMAPDFSRSAWRSIVFSVRTNSFASMVSTTYERTMRRAVLHSDNRNERGEKRLRTARTSRCTRLASYVSPLAWELLEHVMRCASEDKRELRGGRCRTGCWREKRRIIQDYVGHD